MISPEECYAYWHKEYHRFEGKNVRVVKNFAKAKEREYWSCFEQFAQMVNRNMGKINYKIFITALADQYGGYYNPCNLTKRRSIKIYRAYVKEREINSSGKAMKEHIMRSLKFIAIFCAENNIKTFNEYLCHDMYMIPSVLKHLNAGSVSVYFLACIPDFDLMLDSYPIDVVQDFAEDIKENFSVYRIKVIHMNDKLVTTIINRHEHLFNEIIEKEIIKK